MLEKIWTHLKVNLLMLWMSTWKIKWTQPPPDSGNLLVALWHEHLPICIRAFRQKGYTVLISNSKDGEVAARICKRWGYQVHRGNSANSSVGGLKTMVQALRQKQNHPDPIKVGMTLDGSKGPYHRVNPGAAWLASQLNLTTMHPQIQARISFRLNNWDKTIIPLPFSSVSIELVQFLPTGLSANESSARALAGDYAWGFSSSKLGTASKL